MPALSFSGVTSRGPLWKLILLREKTQTVREPRKRPIKKADKLILYWQQRRALAAKKPIHKIGEATCIMVVTMRYEDFAFDDKFARADGFRDAEEMQEWFGDPLEYANEKYDVIYFDLYLWPALECVCHHCKVTWFSDFPPKECSKCGSDKLEVNARKSVWCKQNAINQDATEKQNV